MDCEYNAYGLSLCSLQFVMVLSGGGIILEVLKLCVKLL